jgi:hypothetical chaperone protein
MRFGAAAEQAYMDDSQSGFFLHSPKPMLGSCLSSDFRESYIQVIAQLLKHVKQQAETHCGEVIDQVVFGRPVHYHGLNGEEGDKQAKESFEDAIFRAGFLTFTYLPEPVAAALDFESTVDKDTNVLVLDIGGGTTDCAMVRIGPSFRTATDRYQDILSATGERIGGADFDAQLAYHALWPEFVCSQGMYKDIFEKACNFLHVPFQQGFKSGHYEGKSYVNVKGSQKSRLSRLQTGKYIPRLRHDIEKTKRVLSQEWESTLTLPYIDKILGVTISRDHLGKLISTNRHPQCFIDIRKG